jgi:hypothetical protein
MGGVLFMEGKLLVFDNNQLKIFNHSFHLFQFEPSVFENNFEKLHVKIFINFDPTFT